jgi:hypothetical protein
VPYLETQLATVAAAIKKRLVSGCTANTVAAKSAHFDSFELTSWLNHSK